MQLDIRHFDLPPIGTQCYAVLNPERRTIAVFDAPLNAFATLELLAVETGYSLEGLFFTHGHWDHTLDGARFVERGIPCHGHEGDRLFFEDPQSMASYAIPGMPMPAAQIGTWLEGGQLLEIAGRPVEIRHVPGHSPGSILYWFKEDGLAISGDAVFKSSIGRTDFPGCSFAQLSDSILSKIYTLPGATVLYPGHGPATTVDFEAKHNPFVRRES